MLSSAPWSWRYRQHVPAHALGPAVTNVCLGRLGRALEWATLEEKFAWQSKGRKGFQAEAQLEQGCRGEAARGVGTVYGGCVSGAMAVVWGVGSLSIQPPTHQPIL